MFDWYFWILGCIGMLGYFDRNGFDGVFLKVFVVIVCLGVCYDLSCERGVRGLWYIGYYLFWCFLVKCWCLNWLFEWFGERGYYLSIL